MVNYSIYSMSIRERFMAIIIPGALLFGIGWVFYNNYIAAALLASVSIFYPKIRKRSLISKRKSQLQIQFKNVLYSLASSLGAGKSIESSFIEAAKDLKMLYPDPKTFIVLEVQMINLKVENGEALEKLILDFSNRAQIEDLRNFVDVFITCKRTGGSLVEVIRRTSHIIGEKMEIKQDINVMVAQKRFESRILAIIPFLIVALLSYSSADYMEPLYHDIGIAIMSLSLILLAGCQWLTTWIMDLRV